MNQYKKKLLNHLFIIIGLSAVTIIVTVVLYLSKIHEHTFYFMCGFSASLSVITILLLINYIRVSLDPQRLKQQQIKDADERNILIEQRVQAMSFRIFSGLLAIITIILAFVDSEMMLIFAGILWLAIIVKLVLFIYYKKNL